MPFWPVGAVVKAIHAGQVNDICDGTYKMRE
jgi:hypothetical protein